MIAVQRKATRGQADYGWLKVNYSFSFADYFNPKRMGFRSLRVLNEDRIAPGGGFPSHGHRDMEILTYIIDGSLEHIDSMGHRGVIEAGEFQMMSAGSGVTHSEANASNTEGVHLFQIWVEPSQQGLDPSYKQMRFDDIRNELRLVVAPAGSQGESPSQATLQIHQDVRIFKGQFDAGAQWSQEVLPDRGQWVQVESGTLRINGQELRAGDGAEITLEQSLDLKAETAVKLLLFDLA